MTDPLSLAVLSGVAITEGIKFLYGQAGAILQRRRERKQGIAPDDAPIPIEAPADLLDGRLEPMTIDHAAADELEPELMRLYGQLTVYAHGLQEADPNDAELRKATAQLRDAIEGVVGQRITFRGETGREPSGTPVVTGVVKAREIRGRAVGVELGAAPTVGQYRGEVHADVLSEASDVAGFRAGGSKPGNAPGTKGNGAT
jgi:hypothetical protein